MSIPAYVYTEGEALQWLRNQRSYNGNKSELSRTFGWSEMKVSRMVRQWEDQGLIYDVHIGEVTELTLDDLKTLAAENTVDAGAERAQNAGLTFSQPTPEVKPGIWRRIMSWTVEQLNEHRSKKRGSNAVAVIDRRTVAAPKTSFKVVSDAAPLATHSPSAARPFAPPEPVDGDYVEVSKNSPAVISGGFMLAIGIALSAVGLYNNYYYNAGFGQSASESLQLGTLGLIIDAVAITALSGSIQLWSRNWAYSFIAFALWLGAVVWSMNTTASFTAQLTGDLAAKRGSVIQSATDAREQRSASIKIAEDAAKLAKSRKEKQEANKALAQANSAPLIASPSVVATEAHMFASAEQSRFIRITGFTLFPSFAGLFLAFGMILLRRR